MEAKSRVGFACAPLCGAFNGRKIALSGPSYCDKCVNNINNIFLFICRCGQFCAFVVSKLLTIRDSFF